MAKDCRARAGGQTLIRLASDFGGIGGQNFVKRRIASLRESGDSFPDE
jgi:hypothetical protein